MESREEILMILKMVQDGKITNEDAAKLIEAIEGKKSTGSYKYESREKKSSGSKNSFEEKMENMAEGLENMVSDVVDTTEKAFRNFPDINFGNWFNQTEKRHFSYKIRHPDLRMLSMVLRLMFAPINRRTTGLRKSKITLKIGLRGRICSISRSLPLSLQTRRSSLRPNIGSGTEQKTNVAKTVSKKLSGNSRY